MVSLKIFSFMKKMIHSIHLVGENVKTALFAFGFLALVMLLSLPVLVRIVNDDLS